MSEFERKVRIDALGTAPLALDVSADAAERVALAARFGLVAIHRLHASAEIVREGMTIEARGTIEAGVIQSCVATGDDVPAKIAEPFALRFVPEAIEDGGDLELDEGALDIVTYAGSAIDLGEAAAQTLALALDPWPRAPGAADKLRAAGVVDESEMSPFAMLKGLGTKR